jgi:hypothetical protein
MNSGVDREQRNSLALQTRASQHLPTDQWSIRYSQSGTRNEAFVGVLESQREFDKTLTDRLMLAEIATSPSAPRNDKSLWRVIASEAQQSHDNF